MNKNKRIIQKVVCNEDHFGFVGNPKDENIFIQTQGVEYISS